VDRRHARALACGGCGALSLIDTRQILQKEGLLGLVELVPEEAASVQRSSKSEISGKSAWPSF
jgi:hypothetical protein